MSQNTPTDPQALRAEIEQTRADLGATVEALTGKLDVKAQAKHAVNHATGTAKEAVTQATSTAADAVSQAAGQAAIQARVGIQQAGQIAGNLGQQAKDKAVVVRRQLADGDLPQMTRAVPVAVIAGALALIGVVVWLMRRVRS